MKLEEGMYVRTKDGFIDKIIIDYQGYCNSPYCDCKHISCKHNYYDEKEIIKASYNLIDLIEVGDYVNGLQVMCITEFKDGSRYIEFDDGKYLCKNYQIKSVVTKEQFESMKYEVMKID